LVMRPARGALPPRAAAASAAASALITPRHAGEPFGVALPMSRSTLRPGDVPGSGRRNLATLRKSASCVAYRAPSNCAQTAVCKTLIWGAQRRAPCAPASILPFQNDEIGRKFVLWAARHGLP